MTLMYSCLDGPGEGFGNKTSIQIVGLFKIVRSLRKVYQIDPTSTVRRYLSLPYPS